MNDRYLKLKDAIDVVRETVPRKTVADEYIETTLELRLLNKSLTVDVRENVREVEKMRRYIDANKIEYEDMLRPRGDGNYEKCQIAYRDQIDDIPTAL